jgi:hypothetical protein
MSILRDFQHDFMSPDTIQQRHIAATFLLNHKGQTPDTPIAVYRLLDYFDALAIYFNAGVFDASVLWSAYFYWIGYYYKHCQEAIAAIERDYGAEFYSNLRRMYKTLARYGLRTGKMTSEEEYFSELNMERFLQDELAQGSSADGGANMVIHRDVSGGWTNRATRRQHRSLAIQILELLAAVAHDAQSPPVRIQLVPTNCVSTC